MTPMQELISIIKEGKFDLASASALEVFGGDGTMHTKDYCNEVKSLDVWEINPLKENEIKVNIPQANILICDSYEQVKLTTVHYDMIVVDNPIQEHGGHTEHFDLFPDIFKIMNDDCLLILNVIPSIVGCNKYPELESDTHLRKRIEFYKCNNPLFVTDEELTLTYNNLMRNNGFLINWIAIIPRSFVYYLAMKLRRWNNEQIDRF